MNIESLHVVIPRKEGIDTDSNPVTVWPEVEKALKIVEADEVAFDAARIAMSSSDGCATLANYINCEAKKVHKMDYSFKVPLLVLASELARTDRFADSIFDPDEGILYIETDEAQFAFPVQKDWTVDWKRVADETSTRYEWSGVEHESWALDQLLAFLEIDLDPFTADEED